MNSRQHIFVFLVIAFVWSWFNWFIGLRYLYDGVTDSSFLKFITFLFIGLYGPSISAMLTSFYFGGIRSVVDLLKKLMLFRASIMVYLVIVFLPLITAAISIGLYKLFY